MIGLLFDFFLGLSDMADDVQLELDELDSSLELSEELELDERMILFFFFIGFRFFCLFVLTVGTVATVASPTRSPERFSV